MLDKFDFSPGIVVYNDFHINPDLPFKDQIFSLKEDMFQVNYNDKYLIDIGWNPEFNLNGTFQIRVIKDFDWMSPMYFKETSNLNILLELVKECISILKSQ